MTQQHLAFDVDDPQLRNAVLRIEARFDGTVEPQRGIGDLDRQQDVFRPGKNRAAPAPRAKKQQIRLRSQKRLTR